jgi:preprotein translocase subunit SecE
MSLIKSEDSNKWINGLVILVSLVCGFLLSKFIDQLSIWLDLESKISNISIISQAAGIVFAAGTFFYIAKNSKTSSYLSEVYEELVKVVWPSKDATVKITVGLVVALVIVASIFVSVDFIFKKLLSVIY